jgi:hypothetical protein
MNTIKRTQLPVHKRIQHTADLFGFSFPMRLEPTIYHITSLIAEDYHGGYWQFYTLDNGGFYMAPDFDEPFKVCCENGFEGSLSADALGTAACLYAYSHLSFGQGQFAETCSRHYHLLRDYMLEHPEAKAILGAID